MAISRAFVSNQLVSKAELLRNIVLLATINQSRVTSLPTRSIAIPAQPELTQRDSKQLRGKLLQLIRPLRVSNHHLIR
jgi:hypothetical protein